MIKFINKITGAMKAVRAVAAVADCLGAACKAWEQKWFEHFPEEKTEANAESVG